MNIHLEKGEYLDLPNDLELNISRSNPMLLEQGTYSLPVTLPNTPRNLRLLNHPDRFDNKYKHVIKRTAYINQGIFQKRSSMNILSVSDNGIDAFFQMNESEMYAKMKETSLTSAFSVKRIASEIAIPGLSIADDMDRMIKYLELVMVDYLQDDFYLFEVATDQTEESVPGLRNTTNTYNVLRFINEKLRKINRADPTVITDKTPEGIEYNILQGRVAHTINLDGQYVEVPKGYGISPFLKLSYMLRRIFAYFGYDLQESLFDTDPDMKRIAILNNTSDSIIGGIIDYSQLVPDGNVNSFLDNICKAFGCEFFISEDNQKVNVRFWKEMPDTLRIDKEYTRYLTSRPTIEFAEPQTIKLTFKRSVDYTEVPYDTLASFEKSFGELEYLERNPSPPFPADGFYLIQSIPGIIEIFTNQETLRQERKFHSRPLFDYYVDTDNLEFAERNCDFEYLPNITGYVRKVVRQDEDDEVINYIYMDPIIYIGKRRHMNSVLEKIITNEEGGKETTQVKEVAGSNPLMMAFYWYETRYNSAKYMGSMFHYNDMGAEVGAFDLIPGGKTGLFEYFLKKQDNILRDSNHKISVTLNLPEDEIVGFRMDEFIGIDNQPLLPEKLEYTIKDNRIVVNKVDFRTIRLYVDR